MTAENRAPHSVWPLRRDMGASGYVRTWEDDQIALILPLPSAPGGLVRILMPRRDARMLAERINECLDATTVKALRDASTEPSRRGKHGPKPKRGDS